MMTMGISSEELEAFKEAYRKVFGKDLDDAEASDLAYRLEELYRVLLTKPCDRNVDGLGEHGGDELV